jgi:uncharacterized protein YecT (DUF1311 family)
MGSKYKYCRLSGYEGSCRKSPSSVHEYIENEKKHEFCEKSAYCSTVRSKNTGMAEARIIDLPRLFLEKISNIKIHSYFNNAIVQTVFLVIVCTFIAGCGKNSLMKNMDGEWKGDLFSVTIWHDTKNNRVLMRASVFDNTGTSSCKISKLDTEKSSVYLLCNADKPEEITVITYKAGSNNLSASLVMTDQKNSHTLIKVRELLDIDYPSMQQELARGENNAQIERMKGYKPTSPVSEEKTLQSFMQDFSGRWKSDMLDGNPDGLINAYNVQGKPLIVGVGIKEETYIPFFDAKYDAAADMITAKGHDKNTLFSLSRVFNSNKTGVRFVLAEGTSNKWELSWDGSFHESDVSPKINPYDSSTINQTSKSVPSVEQKNDSYTPTEIKSDNDFKTFVQPTPSFDCQKAANFVEKSICSNPLLAKYDRALSENYSHMKAANIGESAQQDLRKTQKEWLAQRNACTTENCIMTYYTSRLNAMCSYPVISGAFPICLTAEEIK